ncbi:MAG: substrate-binding domain-containing protein [Candidatus Kapabacteria bacterium]|nr:substrate-binding domain-containing protein [Candidatus Kapabacteria bacterium]
MKINILIALVFLFSFCSQEKKDEKAEKNEVKDIKIYCDEAIYNVMKYPLKVFDSIDNKVNLVVTKSNAFDAMKMFLAGECDVILLPRNYTHYEDSMMAVYGVKPHLKMPVAKDALVFFVNYDSPLDTLNDSEIYEIITSKDKKFTDFYRSIKTEPLLVTNSNKSSEVENIFQLVARKKKINRSFKLMEESDSVKSYLLKNKGNIGIGYYANIIGDPQFRALPIGFTDSSGKYIFPRTVHQANILQGFYPYIVTYWVYVQDQNNEDAMRFARFISKHPSAQKHFNDYGIVPAYAKINLIDER